MPVSTTQLPSDAFYQALSAGRYVDNPNNLIKYSFAYEALPRPVTIQDQDLSIGTYNSIGEWLRHFTWGHPVDPQPVDIRSGPLINDSIRNALFSIGAVANIKFELAIDPTEAYLYFAKFDHATTYNPENGTTSETHGLSQFPMTANDGALIAVSNESTWWGPQPTDDGGNYSDSTVIHEILHTLGLSHPHDHGQGTTILDPNLDHSRFTIMSYELGTRNTNSPADYGYAVTPMALDIAVLQKLYGEAENLPQDTTYSWINIGGHKDLVGEDGQIKLGRGFFSIWDTGGNDTIDFSAAAERSLINLNAASLSMNVSEGIASLRESLMSSASWSSLPEHVRSEIMSDYSNFGGFLSTTFSNLTYGGFSIAHNSDVIKDRNVENAIGSSFADVIVGNGIANSIIAGNGDDIIVAGDGDDVVDGGQGKDEIFGGSGNDILNGGDGDDRIDGGDGADIINGGAHASLGDTVSYIGSSAIQINLESTGQQSGGDAQGDVLIGIENVIGTAYADELEGSAAVNRLEGRLGQDTFFIRTIAGANGDILDGGLDNDTLDLSLATFTSLLNDPNGVDKFRFIADLNAGTVKAAGMNASLISIENINGSDLADKLIGNAGVNIINGGGGSDWIFGGAGADIIDGGAGRNKINYIDSIAAVDIDLNRVEQIGGHAQGDQLFNILEVDGSNFADSIRLRSEGWGFVWAAGGNDRIYGGTGENIVYGDVGNDTFYYGGGKSTFYGGIGTNTLDLSLVDKGYLFDLGYVPKVVLANISQQNADETINFFETYRVVGSEGNDTFKMYNKGFFVDGGGGYDTVDLTNLNFNVGKGMTFNMIDGTIKNSVGAFATFANIENFIGSQGDDNFISYGPNGHFFGGNGLDVLWASEYAEWFDGGSVTDRIDYRNSNAAVNVDLGRAVQHGGYAEGDQLFDVEVVVGSNFNDTIDLKSLGHTAVGLDGDDDIFVFNNDTAFGDAGEDHIYINGRYNTIYGGADQDTFHVKGAFDSTQIKDYEYGEQIIFEGYAPGSVTVRVSAEDVYLSFYQQTLYLRGAGYNHAQFSADDILFA